MTNYAKDLNEELLAGSPYCFPEGDSGEIRATELLRLILKIKQQQSAATMAFTDNLSAVREEVNNTLDIQLVFESNAIEQVPTTFAETRDIIQANPAGADFLSAYTFGHGFRDDPKVMEVLGHRDAVLFARDLASAYGGHLREGDIRDIHKLVMASEPRIAGQYKRGENQISGRSFLTSRPEYVSDEVQQLLKWMDGPGSRHTGPHVAAVVHAWISDIHPFEDGNGRVARILANLVLFRGHWPCPIVPSDSRSEYYEALAASDGSDILPLATLFSRSLERVLIEMEDPQYARPLISADLRTVGRYDRWQGAVDRFGQLLADALEPLGLVFEKVGMPSGSGFQLLCDRRRAGNCWFAKIRIPSGQAVALLWFGYQSDSVLAESRPGEVAFPSLFFSERNADPSFPHPYRPLWEDSRLQVHEAVIVPRKSHAIARLREGDNVREVSLEAGAAAAAVALRHLLD